MMVVWGSAMVAGLRPQRAPGPRSALSTLQELHQPPQVADSARPKGNGAVPEEMHGLDADGLGPLNVAFPVVAHHDRLPGLHAHRRESQVVDLRHGLVHTYMERPDDCLEVAIDT